MWRFTYGYIAGLGFWASLGTVWVIGTLTLKYLPFIGGVLL
jgi:hypothetical protein